MENMWAAEVEEENLMTRNPRQMLATGFASPAEDYRVRRLNLNELVVQNKTATYFFRVAHEYYKNDHLYPGDILVIDRSVKLKEDGYAIVVAGNCFRLVRTQIVSHKIAFFDIETDKRVDGLEVLFWGMVTYVIHKSL